MVAAKATGVLATVLVNKITMMWIHCVERCSVLIFFILGAKQLLCTITCWPFHKACNSPFPSAVPRVQSLILGQSGGRLVTPSNCTAAAASFLNEEVDSGCCDAQHFSWCCAKSSSSPLSAHSSLISFFSLQFPAHQPLSGFPCRWAPSLHVYTHWGQHVAGQRDVWE